MKIGGCQNSPLMCVHAAEILPLLDRANLNITHSSLLFVSKVVEKAKGQVVKKRQATPPRKAFFGTYVFVGEKNVWLKFVFLKHEEQMEGQALLLELFA